MLKEFFDLYLRHVNLHNSLHSVCLRFRLRLSLSLNDRMAIQQQNSCRFTIWQFRFKLFCHEITIWSFRFKLKCKRNLRYFENTTIDRSYSTQLNGKTIVTSGGSRISPRRGHQLPGGGANIRFCHIFPKTA